VSLKNTVVVMRVYIVTIVIVADSLRWQPIAKQTRAIPKFATPAIGSTMADAGNIVMSCSRSWRLLSMDEKRRCHSCKFWKPDAKLEEQSNDGYHAGIGEEKYGECRANPPETGDVLMFPGYWDRKHNNDHNRYYQHNQTNVPIMPDMGPRKRLWVITEREDWCGRHRMETDDEVTELVDLADMI